MIVFNYPAQFMYQYHNLPHLFIPKFFMLYFLMSAFYSKAFLSKNILFPVVKIFSVLGTRFKHLGLGLYEESQTYWITRQLQFVLIIHLASCISYAMLCNPSKHVLHWHAIFQSWVQDSHSVADATNISFIFCSN